VEGVPANDANYALSLKQPWAALVVHGLKTIEVRRWPTARLGRIWIHAARISDPRQEAWKHVPNKLTETATLTGGIIGSVELIDCIAYRDLDTFLRDQPKHLNEAAWFEPPELFGFVFSEPRVTPFRMYPGWFRFFEVHDEKPERRQSRKRA
jgi:hypothetical protein